MRRRRGSLALWRRIAQRKLKHLRQPLKIGGRQGLRRTHAASRQVGRTTSNLASASVIGMSSRSASGRGGVRSGNGSEYRTAIARPPRPLSFALGFNAIATHQSGPRAHAKKKQLLAVLLALLTHKSVI